MSMDVIIAYLRMQREPEVGDSMTCTTRHLTVYNCSAQLQMVRAHLVLQNMLPDLKRLPAAWKGIPLVMVDAVWAPRPAASGSLVPAHEGTSRARFSAWQEIPFSGGALPPSVKHAIARLAKLGAAVASSTR